MKRSDLSKNITGLLILLLAVAGCGLLPERSAETDTNTANANAENTAPKPEKTPDFTGEVTFPFEGFPPVPTTAKTGEYVLVPMFKWLVDAMEKGGDKVTFIWYRQKMSNPGKERSEVQFISERREIPNAYIIPIQAGEKAKNGDIVLTWWQSGSGMQRAIVVDGSTPAEPIVRYLDREHDRSVKGGDDGPKEEKLRPDTFVVLRKEMEPGTAVAITDGADLRHGQVIRAAGDHIFVKMFAGKAAVFPRSDVQPVPLVPNVKKGDRVRALNFGKFDDGTVAEVDAKVGRVWVRFDGRQDEKAVAFGDILLK